MKARGRAPRLKQRINRRAKLKPYWDSIAIVQNTTTYKLFPGTATGQRGVEQNYEQNPFPSNKTRSVLGVELDINLHSIYTYTDIDPSQIANALKFGGVTMSLDQNRQLALEIPVADLLSFDNPITMANNGNATPTAPFRDGVNEIVSIGSGGQFRLPRPIHVKPNQVFDFTVTFKDASNFPTLAQWQTAGYPNGLVLIAKLWVAEV